MNRIKLVAYLLIASFIYSCTGSGKSVGDSSDNPVVGVVDGQRILLSELHDQFYRTSVNQDQVEDIDSKVQELRSFLPLYVDYRVKLASAREANYFNDPEILQELSQYETQTAFPYWLENKVRDQLLTELDERSKFELNASHILINIPENATPRDTLDAWNKLIEAREIALTGVDFDSLSNVYSSVRNGRSVGGPLGYFSAGWAVKDFEDAAYALSPGEVSMPFRSQFGYHIIKLYDKRAASLDRLLSHVFFRVSSEAEIDEVLEVARMAFEEYTSGQLDWANFVQNYSQDPQSGPMEGRIGWVNHGRYDPRFTDVVMAIENPGDITEPFFSGYGVHVVRLDSIRSFGTEEQRRSELMGRLQSLPRYRDNRSITLKNVRESGDESIFTQPIERFETLISANRGNPYSSIDFESNIDLNSIIYRIKGRNFTLNDYLKWIMDNTDTSSTNSYNFSYRDRFFNFAAEQQIVPITKDVFPEFQRLSREYLNGLVIFKISEDSVWNYAKADSFAVRNLFDQNPSKYRFDDRYFFQRITANSDTSLNRVLSLIAQGQSTDQIRSSVAGLVIRNDVLTDVSQEPYNKLSSLTPGSITEAFMYRNRPTVFLLERKEESRDMTFDEAYFRVVSEYQPIREELWLQRIRSKFNAVQFPDRITAGAIEKMSN